MIFLLFVITCGGPGVTENCQAHPVQIWNDPQGAAACEVSLQPTVDDFLKRGHEVKGAFCVQGVTLTAVLENTP